MKKSLIYIGIALLVLIVAFFIAKPRVANNAYQKAVVLADSSLYELAMNKVDFALMLSTKPEYLDLKGLILQKTGADSAAITFFDRAIALDSTVASPFLNEGVSLKNLQQWEPAIVYLNRAISLDDSLAKAYYNRGVAKAGLLKFDEAIEDYVKSAQLDGTNKEAFYKMGASVEALNDFNKAISAYSKLIESGAANADAYKKRGIFRVKLKDFKGGDADLSKATQLDGKDVEAWYYLGLAQANEQKGSRGAKGLELLLVSRSKIYTGTLYTGNDLPSKAGFQKNLLPI